MAITYDAPSSGWDDETITTPQPRVLYAIPQTNSSIVYELDYIVSPDGFSKMALDSSYISSTLAATLAEAGGTMELVDAGSGAQVYGQDFPQSGKVKIGDEFINYTGVNYTTNELTGLARGVDEGTVTSVDVEHTLGATVDFAAWLVEETNPQPMDGDLVTYTRRFAMVPDGWSSYEMRPYTFLGYYDDTAEGDYRAPLQKVVPWFINHYYEHSTDAFDDVAVPGQAQQSKDAQGTVYEYVDDSDTIPSYTTYTGWVSGSANILASDSQMDVYLGKGRIYHTTALYVKAE